MAINEKLCFVQFLHPGGEPDLKRGPEWNNSNRHTRKYLLTRGRYLDGDDRVVSGEIEFWGEWEAQSVGAKVYPIKNQENGKPKWLWRPYYSKMPDYTRLQNTDPFVFGGFYYTGCQQRTRSGPTQLRHLQRGSVVLFGSCVDDQFAIDTVFVVKDWIDHNAATYRQKLYGRVPDAYWNVTLLPRYSKEKQDWSFGNDPDSCIIAEATWRLYIGATYAAPYEGMFSFFPCQPAGAMAGGFARPSIRIPGIVNPRVVRKYRVNPQASIDGVRSLWQRVVRQVRAQGLDLGIAAEVPPSGRP